MRSFNQDSFLGRFIQHAHREPSKVALVCFGAETEAPVKVTYSELLLRAAALGHRLRQEKQTGERALILLPTGADYAAALLGCFFAGVVAAPVYPPSNGMHAERVSRILADCSAKRILTTRAVFSGFQRRLDKALGDAQVEVLFVDDEARSLAEETFGAEAQLETAYLQYTSGSTGHPRGVIVTHANLTGYHASWQQRFGHSESDVFVSWLPLFHDMGLLLGLIQPLLTGATTVLMPPPSFLQQPRRWLAAITEFAGTVSPAPNFAFDICTNKIPEAQLEGLDLSSWRFAINGAEPVRADTVRRFCERFGPYGFKPESMIVGYGLAETTLGVTTSERGRGARIIGVAPESLRNNRYQPSAAGDRVELASCGPVLSELDVRIVDPNGGTELPAGHVGELWVRGPGVTAGYWQLPDLTKASFGAHLASGAGPYLRTGDLAMFVDDEIVITGRLKDVLIVRGQNHYPQDIEHTALAAHPALAGSRGAAFCVPDSARERIALVLEVKRTSRKSLDGDAVVRSVRSAVTEAHGINLDSIVLVSPGTIRVTSSGKIQRSASRDEYLADTLHALFTWNEQPSDSKAFGVLESPPDASTPFEQAVTLVRSCVAQVRGVSEPQSLDATAPFSELGLDSYHLVELSSVLSTQIGRTVDTSDLFNHPSITRLASFLSNVEQPIAARPTPESGVDDRIAVIGMACRFPGAATPDEFWHLLSEGEDAIREVPTARWPHTADLATQRGGFIPDVEMFDANFFGIAPREVASMDPQQRLLLELCWHALEDAGIPPSSLAGSNTGVFLGVSGSDYTRVQWRMGAGQDAYAGTGRALSIGANRISYFLDLRGPSWAVDTACSSSLVAVHHARLSLLRGECALAIVAGVNLLLDPDLSVVFSRAQMLAPDGACKTFDAAANGYVRGEGCGVVILKRATDARRDAHRVRALLLGSAINQDGRTHGLTAPNGVAQQEVLRQALADAKLEPADIGYLEAHGTGTPLGDPIEVRALNDVFGKADESAPPLWLGAVKANIGHLEAAAGIAGLIKAVLVLQNRTIPKQVHFNELNPRIDLSASRCRVAQQTQQWTGSRFNAGVSAFGFGGTNAHVVLGAVDEHLVPVNTTSTAESSAVEILPLSASSSASLRLLALRHAENKCCVRTAPLHSARAPMPRSTTTTERSSSRRRCSALLVEIEPRNPQSCAKLVRT